MAIRVTPDPRYVWTGRHWWVPAIGWIFAVIYAVGLRVACRILKFPDPEIVVVALTGMVTYWFGILCARLMLFKRAR